MTEYIELYGNQTAEDAPEETLDILTFFVSRMTSMLGMDTDAGFLLIALIISLAVAVGVVIKARGESTMFVSVLVGCFLVFWGVGWVSSEIIMLFGAACIVIFMVVQTRAGG